MPETERSYTRLWHQILGYTKLNIEYARLTAAEKVSLLLTAAAVATGVFVLGVICFFFLSIALATWLSEIIPLALAYALMGIFFLILMILVIVFRKPLILNPVTRFISRLFLS